MARLANPAKWALIRLVRVYRRWISRWFPPVCRFHPSCSSYALEALETKPFFTAVAMIAWRIARCNPMSAGGYDPVTPDPPSTTPFQDNHESNQRANG